MRFLLPDFLVVALLAVALTLAAANQPSEHLVGEGRSLAAIKRSGELVVITQNSPATYYLDRDGNAAGLEYDLVESFARRLGVTVRYEIKTTVAEVLGALAAGEGDIASAALTVTPQRSSRFLFGPSYQKVSQQVVCRRGGARPRSIAELSQVELVVIAGSSYEERVGRLYREHPQLNWRTSTGLSAEQLLEKVWRREEQCTVMDSNIVALNQRYYPELRVRFELGEQDSLAWALPKGAHGLQTAAGQWFEEFANSGQLAGLQERYFGHHVEQFDYVDTAAFIRRIHQRYPQYRHHFREAAENYGLSEYLLAAQAYQESHWNPSAISPTGVRGIMMLTLPTAEAMGVSSRLDVEANVLGGARYLAQLKDLLAAEIEEPNLTWFALAAYNVGLGHLRDAQSLARQMGMNPNEWHDLKEVLPMLSEPRYYKTLKYGYARGLEPVRYVQQVRRYEQIIAQQLEQILVSEQGREALAGSGELSSAERDVGI